MIAKKAAARIATSESASDWQANHRTGKIRLHVKVQGGKVANQYDRSG